MIWTPDPTGPRFQARDTPESLVDKSVVMDTGLKPPFAICACVNFHTAERIAAVLNSALMQTGRAT